MLELFFNSDLSKIFVGIISLLVLYVYLKGFPKIKFFKKTDEPKCS